jgi:hypothetical protein
VQSQGQWRSIRARVLARRGDGAEAEAEAESLARESVAILARTDWLVHRAESLAALAEVLRAGGRTQEAAAALREALALAEQKGDLVNAARLRASLEELAA